MGSGDGGLMSPRRFFAGVASMVALDQVTKFDCGVVTTGARAWLEQKATDERPWVLADSRSRVGLFTNVCLKPNARECLTALGGDDLLFAARQLAARANRPVFCTRGEEGIVVALPDGAVREVPGMATA